MHCPNCGCYLDDDLKKCPKCETLIVHKKKYFNNIGIVSSLILIISYILPFISLSLAGFKKEFSLSDNGLENHGIIIVIIGAFALLFSFLNNNTCIVSMGVMSLTFSMYITNYLSDLKNYSEYDWFDLSLLVNKEIGYYMMFIGAILLLFAGIYGKITKKKTIFSDE